MWILFCRRGGRNGSHQRDADARGPPPLVDAPARDWQLKWDERAPVPSETIELRVPAKAYFFCKEWELKDVKGLRPQQPGPNCTRTTS